MKKNLTFIAMIATALICSCGSDGSKETAEDGENVAAKAEKPKVKVATVETEEVAQYESYSTTVEAMVKNNISPNAPLRIDKILVEVGDEVKMGQKLVQLDASSLDQLKLQIEQQKLQIGQQKLQIEQQTLQFEQLETEFKREKELYTIGGSSKTAFENMKTQLEVSKKSLEVSKMNLEVSKKSLEVSKKSLANRLENTVLISPVDGVVSARNYDNGDMSGGQPILVIEQVAPVKMKINISESRYAQTNENLDVVIKFNTYGDEKFKGNVNLIYPTIDSKTHTFPLEIVLENTDARIRPGMYGKATVNFGTKSHVVVPDKAVIKQAGSGSYFVYTYADGKVKRNSVEVGQRIGDRYELLSGIENGSTVVVSGHTNLADGVEVEVIK